MDTLAICVTSYLERHGPKLEVLARGRRTALSPLGVCAVVATLTRNGSQEQCPYIIVGPLEREHESTQTGATALSSIIDIRVCLTSADVRLDVTT